MKSIVNIIFFFICSISFAQTNLLDSSTWTVGTGSVTGFTRTGVDAENIREMGIGPHGTSMLLWKTVPEATGNTGAGGWTTDLISIDPTKTYRTTVWIKKTNSNDGTSYARFRAFDGSGNTVTNNLDGTPNVNPFFWYGDPPTLDKWYLLVGYVHHKDYAITTSIGGVYDGVTGAKIENTTDFKFGASSSQILQMIWLSANTNTADSQYYYDPTIYEVNGQEPSIQQLIDGPDTETPTAPSLSSAAKTDTTADLNWTAATDNVAVTGYKVYKDGTLETTLGNVLSYQITGLNAQSNYDFTVSALDPAGNESVVSNTLAITTDATSGSEATGNWALNNQDVYYNTGKVGIGTTTPDETLAVNGNIHAKEVRVDLQGWPDYVFTDTYHLPSLKEVEDHIKSEGHLPNIPSAQKVDDEGIHLGQMKIKLLEKIEELTLYIIAQQKHIEAQSETIKNIQKALKK